MPKIAILVPCYNEEATIGRVIADFRQFLPNSSIYVYDNNSKDATIEVATKAGAIVRSEPRQGKGNVVRRMFADVDADIYIMVDGDSTYDAQVSPALVDMILRGFDIVNVARDNLSTDAYRPGHKFGNWLLTSLVSLLFGRQTTDMLSGYKAFSHRFVKSFPAISSGFEIETELTIHALELQTSIGELRAPYVERPAGSVSKLNTFHDGFRIMRMIGAFVKNEKPFLFFTAFSAAILAVSILVAAPVVIDFVETGFVPRLPSAVLAASLAILAALSFLAGVILDAVTLGRKEAKRLRYLELQSPHSLDRRSTNTIHRTDFSIK